MNNIDPVGTWRMKNKKGRSTTIEMGSPGIPFTAIITAVAAAASVPDSSIEMAA
jgi:hypothetical protein